MKVYPFTTLLLFYRLPATAFQSLFERFPESLVRVVQVIHCNAVITRVTGAIKSNRIINDTAL